jgi:hypothetical protein
MNPANGITIGLHRSLDQFRLILLSCISNVKYKIVSINAQIIMIDTNKSAPYLLKNPGLYSCLIVTSAGLYDGGDEDALPSGKFIIVIII